MYTKVLQRRRTYFADKQDAEDYKYDYHPFGEVVKNIDGSYYIEYELWVNL